MAAQACKRVNGSKVLGPCIVKAQTVSHATFASLRRRPWDGDPEEVALVLGLDHGREQVIARVLLSVPQEGLSVCPKLLCGPLRPRPLFARFDPQGQEERQGHIRCPVPYLVPVLRGEPEDLADDQHRKRKGKALGKVHGLSWLNLGEQVIDNGLDPGTPGGQASTAVLPQSPYPARRLGPGVSERFPPLLVLVQTAPNPVS